MGKFLQVERVKSLTNLDKFRWPSFFEKTAVIARWRNLERVAVNWPHSQLP
jgi:hypothetical protein